MGFYIVKEPNYFRSFSCSGSSCTSNCCRDWKNLIWLNEEYQRLCSADLPSGMREKVQSAFVRLDIPELDEPLWNLKLTRKKCHFLAENSLCSIQQAFGEDFISNTCRIYPRVSVFNRAVMTRGCFSSCPEIVKTLLNDEFALEICTRQVQVIGDEVILHSVLCEGEEDFREYPALRFRNELFSLFYDIIADRTRPLEENLLLGIKIAEYLSAAEKTDEIPARIKEIKTRFNSAIYQPNISEYKRYLNKASEIFGVIFGDNKPISEILDNGFADIEKLKRGAMVFPTYFFRNLALNLLFELRAPFYFSEKSIFENYIYLFAVDLSAALCVVSAELEYGVSAAAETLSEFYRTVVHDSDIAEEICMNFCNGN